MKNVEEKHKRIVSDYSTEKSKHLERQASQMLKQDESNTRLKGYDMKGEFFDLF